MYFCEVIKESLIDSAVLEVFQPYIFSQRVQEVAGDEFSIWHIYAYLLPKDKLKAFTNMLEKNIKMTWYTHAFNQSDLHVVLSGKTFELPRIKNATWEEMIAYGVDCCQVERHYLETIPVTIKEEFKEKLCEGVF